MGLFGRKNENKEQPQQKSKKIWKCEHCSMTFDEKDRLKRHMRKAHSERGGSDLPSTSPFGFG
jgi:uncharacterized C2H2 Zn-finger protein